MRKKKRFPISNPTTTLCSKLEPPPTLELHTGWIRPLQNHVLHIHIHIPFVIPSGGVKTLDYAELG
jgi:hypothetical protein